MSVEIKKVIDEKQLSEVAVLADEIWHECFKGIITEAQIDYMVEKFQSETAMKNQVNDDNYSYFGVYNSGELCGYFGVKPESNNKFFLSKLYLRCDMRGKGIARKMLECVFSEAKAAGKDTVYLTVNKHNNHAVDVYKAVGFVTADSTVTDIGSGFVMDDYVMEYKL